LAKIISKTSSHPLGYRVRTLSVSKRQKSKQKLALSFGNIPRECHSGSYATCRAKVRLVSQFRFVRVEYAISDICFIDVSLTFETKEIS
jgi:hypothetical protein